MHTKYGMGIDKKKERPDAWKNKLRHSRHRHRQDKHGDPSAMVNKEHVRSRSHPEKKSSAKENLQCKGQSD